MKQLVEESDKSLSEQLEESSRFDVETSGDKVVRVDFVGDRITGRDRHEAVKVIIRDLHERDRFPVSKELVKQRTNVGAVESVLYGMRHGHSSPHIEMEEDTILGFSDERNTEIYSARTIVNQQLNIDIPASVLDPEQKDLLRDLQDKSKKFRVKIEVVQ